MKKKLITVGIIAALSTFPILFGLPFTLGFNNKVIEEVVILVFGLLELLAVNIRVSFKDKKLYKNNMTKEEFNNSEEKVKYLNVQRILLISGFLNILLSILYFYLFN